MFELAIFAIVAVVVTVAALLYFAPSMRGRGHYDSEGKNLAEAKAGIAFVTDDEEHRFSGSRTGMMLDKRGYKIKKRRRL